MVVTSCESRPLGNWGLIECHLTLRSLVWLASFLSRERREVTVVCAPSQLDAWRAFKESLAEDSRLVRGIYVYTDKPMRYAPSGNNPKAYLEGG